MTEREASKDLYARGIFQIAPGLWCDTSVPDMIQVHDDRDTAFAVRRALVEAGQLPDVQRGGGENHDRP